MNKLNAKGFTLIELLVVIAIIGILSTIAMTSLNGAKKKASDAAFKAAVTGALPGMTMCCDAGGTPTTTDGAEICDATHKTGAAWPKVAKADITSATCDTANGGFDVSFNIPNPFGGNCTSPATCDENGCTFSGC